MVGRTHGVHAEPITFGAKLAGWAFELERDRERLARALEGMRVGKLAGAVGTYGGGDPEVERLACERLGLVPEPAATQVVPRDRYAELLSALAVTAASLDRFATEIRHLARTEVREVQEPFRKGQKGSSAMPHKRNPVVAERISGLSRASYARPPSSASRTSPSGTSATSPTRARSGSSSLTRSWPSTTCSTASRGSSTGSSSTPSGCGETSTPRTASSSASACCSRSSPRGSRATTRTGSCSETRSPPGTRSGTSGSLLPPTPEIAARLDAEALAERLRPRRRAPPCRRPVRAPRGARGENPRAKGGSRSCLRPSTSRAARSARSTSSTTDRLLLVASDRISTFDVVLPTDIPDKGRVLTGLSGFWFARTREIVPNHLLALRGDGRSTEARRLDMLPIECVVRGYLAGSGWKDYLGTGEVCGHRLPGGLRESEQASHAHLHAGDEGARGARREHRPGRARALVGEELFDRGRADLDRALRVRGRVRRRPWHHHRRHEVRARDRRRRDADPRRRGADAGLVPLLAGGRVRAGPLTAVLRQAVRAGLLRVARLGQDASGPGAPTGGRRRHARTIRRGVRARHRDRVRRLPREPGRGAPMRATVLVRPKGGILDPAGRGRRAARFGSSASPSRTRASAA